MTTPLPVCVIGAGLSGLASIKKLRDRGIEVECFEIGSDIGGNWRYDNDNGRSPAYASLHIDTSRDRFQFADFPMPKHFPVYPHHSQVLEYLEAYTKRFGLRTAISFRREVVSVNPVADDQWDVEVKDLDTGTSRVRSYRAVVVSNGHHWLPNIPDAEGPFAGDVIHAQAYRTPEPFIGKDVVVVGVGNTGVDIACDLSWHAKSVTLSTRSGAHVLPRYVLGRPLDRLSTRLSSRMPLAMQQTIYSALLFAVRGRQEEYGFPVPDAPVLTQHPTVSQDVLRLVKDGQIDVQRGISRTTEGEVVFVDGTTKAADAIIYATGYRIGFPFLDDDVAPVSDNYIGLYKRVVPPDWPGLYFVGLIQPVGALPPLVEAQARWVSILVDGAPLPTVPTMKAEISRDRQALEDRYQDRQRHTIQVDYWPYLDSINGLCDLIDG